MWMFKVEPPAALSVSGGRTSMYMLRRILDAHGGRLPPAVVPIFANTGKEKPETLDFVRECAARWGVAIRWVEFVPDLPRFREVTYETASRAGEPFEALIRWKQYLPNPIQRICTQHLKIETMKRFIRGVLGFEEWTTYVGIRHDEPRRWRIVGQDSRNPREFKEAPLIEARITKEDVLRFWSGQPFDLALSPEESNCDLCFLKGKKKLLALMAERPEMADWWIAQESIGFGKTPNGAVFRADRATYAAMQREARGLPIVREVTSRSPRDISDDYAIAEELAEEDALPCACHD
jgi:hypothetical protein